MQAPLASVSGVRVSLTVTMAHPTACRALAWCSCAISAHHLRKRLDLRGAGRAASLTDVLVLLAVEEHEEKALADRHRLPAARAVEEARLERPVALGLLAASRRSTEHGQWLTRRLGRRNGACRLSDRPV